MNFGRTGKNPAIKSIPIVNIVDENGQIRTFELKDAYFKQFKQMKQLELFNGVG